MGDVFIGAGLESVTISDSVTTLLNECFRYCTKLENCYITQNSELNSVGEYCFDNCVSLDSIYFPVGVTSIEKYTFNWCPKLDTIVLSGDLVSIGGGAFCNCSKLSTLTFSSGLQSLSYIGDMAFYNCSKLDLTISVPSSVSIGTDAFSGIGSINITYTN